MFSFILSVLAHPVGFFDYQSASGQQILHPSVALFQHFVGVQQAQRPVLDSAGMASRVVLGSVASQGGMALHTLLSESNEG